MTIASFFTLSPRPRALWIFSLIAASVLLSPAFHCGFPLAAFAAIAALTLDRRDVLLLSGGVWLTNQTIVFASLHHHADVVAFAWSGALGVIALLCCEAAGLIARRMKGFAGASLAFVAAFVVYKIMIFGFGVAVGSSASHFDSLLATLPRSSLVNACVFVGLGALYALSAAARHNGEAFAPAPVTSEAQSDGLVVAARRRSRRSLEPYSEDDARRQLFGAARWLLTSVKVCAASFRPSTMVR